LVESKRQALLSALSISISIFILFVVATTEYTQITINHNYPDNTVIIELPEQPIEPIEPTFELEYAAPAIDDIELDCLARNIYHEARGESSIGKLAVAYVTVNRVRSNRFPDTVCGVVHQAVYSTWWWEAKGKKVPVRNMCQFSWYCDGKSDTINLTTASGRPIKQNIRAWEESKEIALAVLLGEVEDPTHGAKWYYNPKLADPEWQHAFVKTAMVGNHKFMKAM
jgi:spore germination cell wall hydrolase CwlJ-like protein